MSYSIGIYQSKSSNLADIIANALFSAGFNIILPSNSSLSSAEKDILFYPADCAALFPDSLDICILESGYRNSNSFPTASHVTIPDICNISTVNQLCPQSIVTYGLSCKNTITVSSVIRNNMVASIQRELITVTGARVDAQEFSISLRDINNIDAALAAIAVLLQLSIPVEKIKQLDLC